MTDEEIEVLVTRLEKSLHAQMFAASKVSWLFGGVALPLTFIEGTNFGFGAFAAVMAAVGWLSTGIGREEWGSFQQRRASMLWREWVRREAFKEAGRGLENTVRMRADILEAVQKVHAVGTWRAMSAR